MEACEVTESLSTCSSEGGLFSLDKHEPWDKTNREGFLLLANNVKCFDYGVRAKPLPLHKLLDIPTRREVLLKLKSPWKLLHVYQSIPTSC